MKRKALRDIMVIFPSLGVLCDNNNLHGRVATSSKGKGTFDITLVECALR